MSVTHTMASGMGGLRAAGDLVARLQMSKGMRIQEAKEHVAAKLGVTTRDLSDNLTMHELRGELRMGRIYEGETTYFNDPSPLEAKYHIAERLDISINSVDRFKRGLGIGG